MAKVYYRDDKLRTGYSFNCSFWPDEETPVSIWDEEFRVDWYNAGEGNCGDYNPIDPEDVNNLRFDVYYRVGERWDEVDDASYCTCVPADTSLSRLKELALAIFRNYKDSGYPDCSVKKLGESLSYISA